MKEMMRQVRSYIAFDYHLYGNHVGSKFADTHQLYRDTFPGWSTKATRQKLIAGYWFSDVLIHFSFLFGISLLIAISVYGKLDIHQVPGILLTGMLALFVLVLFNYWPIFTAYYLPELETAKEKYDYGQVEQQDKCRKAQLSNLALTLVFYVFDKTSAINTLQSTDQYAVMLNRLYGVDRASLRGNLEIIMGNSNRRKTWTDRQRTETWNRFEEARNFLQELNFSAGLQVLKELETKILGA